MSARILRFVALTFAAVGIGVLTLTATGGRAGAATPPVGLGTATSYAVLAGSTITNTGPTTVQGDIGLSPGSAITGFPPGTASGATHAADAEALQAKSDLVTAYDDAAGRTPATSVATELGGTTLLPGTYVGATLGLTGALTLDAGGDPHAVFLIKSESTLITATDSSVLLINGADPCNVYWQVSSSATLGTRTSFMGTVMALTSITANNGATVVGSLLARNGAVTLDNNVITRPICALPPTTTTTSPDSTSTTTTTTPGGTSTTVAPTTTVAVTPTSTIPGGTGTTIPGDTGTTIPGTGTLPPGTPSTCLRNEGSGAWLTMPRTPMS